MTRDEFIDKAIIELAAAHIGNHTFSAIIEQPECLSSIITVARLIADARQKVLPWTVPQQYVVGIGDTRGIQT